MILDRRPWSDPLGGLRGWGRGQNSSFLEYVHVAYQIKENDACSNMEKNIMPADTFPLTLGLGSKGQNSTSFQNMVMLHIKLKDMTHAATWLQILYPQTPSPPPP